MGILGNPRAVEEYDEEGFLGMLNQLEKETGKLIKAVILKQKLIGNTDVTNYKELQKTGNWRVEMKKWKSIIKHPLKKKKKRNAIYIISKRNRLYMEMSEVKKGVRRFNRTVISIKELKLLREVRIIQEKSNGYKKYSKDDR